MEPRVFKQMYEADARKRKRIVNRPVCEACGAKCISITAYKHHVTTEHTEDEMRKARTGE